MLRLAGPRALTRKTSEREKAQVLQDVIGLWKQEAEHRDALRRLKEGSGS